MDKSLKQLEDQLSGLTPRGLSDQGRDSCHMLIDDLVKAEGSGSRTLFGLSWVSTSIAASVALSLGLGAGWYLGNDEKDQTVADVSLVDTTLVAGFEQLDRVTWMQGDVAPDVYVSKDGEVREISQEIEVTTEVVRHRKSGVVVTLETTDHHLVDTVKSEF